MSAPAPSERCGKELRYPEAWLPCDLPKGHDGAHYPAPLADGLSLVKDALRGRIKTTAPAPAPTTLTRSQVLNAFDALLPNETVGTMEDADQQNTLILLLDHDAALRARVAELERVIEEAPHGSECESRRDYGADEYHHGPCDCWKAAALEEIEGVKK